MGPKRSASASSAPDNRQKKRTKVLDSRRIKIQHTDPALKDGRLDVPTFLKTREFEINQLEQTMFNSKKINSKRAFQKVPRELRRRTASHNAKRVPPRRRKRAIQEMTDTPSKETKLGRGHQRAKHMAIEKARTAESKSEMEAAGESKEEYEQLMHSKDTTGINERVAVAPKGRKIQFKSRQRDKVWLPTHVWHAKRAHMVAKWGYSVAERPTAKSYRPTHRASTQSGAVAWDASYYCNIVVLQNVENALREIGAEKATRVKYKSGKRSWNGLLSVDAKALGPGMVCWQPCGDQSTTGEQIALVRVHPALFDAVFDTLKLVSTVHDCRYSIGSIDITGPKALPALRSILKPWEHNALWNEIACVSNCDSLPDMTLPLDVYDSRLFHSKNFKVTKKGSSTISDIIVEWSKAETTRPSSLFTPEGRQTSYANQPSLQALTSRQKEPGKDIPVEPTDPKIPTILIKHGNMWTLLLPWHWVLPFWHSLMSVSNVRLGGIDQRQQLAYEQGHLFFPNDYIFTPAGLEYNRIKAQQQYDKWSARPPAKRTNYSKFEPSLSPFGCDWHGLTGGATVVLNSETTNETNDKTADVTPILLTMKSRGCPQDGARIMVSDTTIGFVCSGSYNLTNGKGTAVALALTQQLPKEKNTILMVRNIGSSTVREATFRLI